ncbi:MAG: hypothetical protein AAGC85_03310 [Bacteroidota bacterium]
MACFFSRQFALICHSATLLLLLLFPLASQGQLGLDEMGEWYLKERLKIVDKNVDQALSLEEMAPYYSEFRYYLHEHTYYYSDLDQDGTLNMTELATFAVEEMIFRDEAERIDIKRYEAQYPFLAQAKVTYLKKHPELTEKLVSNYYWISEHLPLAFQLANQKYWMRKNGDVLIAWLSNFRCLVAYPRLAEKLYNIPIEAPFKPRLVQWQAKHNEYLLTNNTRSPEPTSWSISPAQLFTKRKPYPTKNLSRELSLSNDSLRTVNSAYQRIIEIQSTELETVRSENQQLFGSNLQQKESLTELRKKTDQAEKALMDAERDLKLLKGAMKELGNQFADMKIEFQTKWDSVRSRNTNLRGTTKDQQTRIAKLQREKSALENRLVQLEKQQSTASNEALDTYKRKVQEQQVAIAKLSAEKDRIQRRFNAKTQAQSDSLSQLQNALFAVSDQQEETEGIRLTTSTPALVMPGSGEIQDSLLMLKQQLFSAGEKNTSLNAKVDELKASRKIFVERMQAQLREVEEQLSAREGLITYMSREVDSLSRALAVRGKITPQPQQPNNTVQAERLVELQQRVDRLNLENESLSEQIESNVHFISLTLTEKEQLESQLHEREKQLQQLQAELLAMNEAPSSETVSIYSSDSLIIYRQKLRSLKEELTLELSNDKKRLEIYQTQNEDLKQQLDALAGELDHTEKTLKTNQARLVSLENKQKNIDKLQQQLSSKEQLIKQKEAYLEHKLGELGSLETFREKLKEKENKLQMWEQRLKQRKTESGD